MLWQNPAPGCFKSKEEIRLFKSDLGVGARFLERKLELNLKDPSEFASLREFRV